jgi:hypothetical protein
MMRDGSGNGLDQERPFLAGHTPLPFSGKMGSRPCQGREN